MNHGRKNKTYYSSYCIYHKVLARELRLALKPLGIGFIILAIFLTIAEWSDVIFGHNCKEPFGILGIIGFFLPVMIKYYKRIRAWVLKWK